MSEKKGLFLAMFYCIIICLIAGSFLFLGGCASYNDRDIAVSNNETIQNHDNAQSRVAVKKVDGINQVFQSVTSKCTDNTFACGALTGMAASNASRDIASIKTQEYNGPTQKTSVDVQQSLVEKTGLITLGVVAVNGQNKSQRPNQVVNTGGGDAQLDHSMTASDQTVVTGSGSSNVASTPTSTTTKDSPVDNSVSAPAETANQ